MLVVLLQGEAQAQGGGQFYSGRYGKREGSTQMNGNSGTRSRSGTSGFLANRYGRSGGRVLELTPRSYRFIPGSRYGKRSESAPHNMEEEVSLPSLLLSDNTFCLLVEQPDLYRCSRSNSGSDEEAD
ncbi:hypothetical protein FHG87_014233 [Trinorchestia longiramus]|nr:hypothetical protein FHG87_014233 [Trinorchestia longiramus]